MKTETKLQRLERRRSQLTAERSNYISHWRELQDYLSPRTSRFFNTDKNENKGVKANDKIINSTATTALRTLKSGLMAGVTSPARPWFRLITSDSDLMESSAVKQWLFDVESKLRIVFSRSNFYNTLPMLYGSLGAYGTGALAIVEDEDAVIRCHSYPVGQFCIALNDQLRCDTFSREFQMTVRQLVMQFGKDNLPDAVKVAFENGSYEKQYEVCHLIEYNLDRDTGKLDSKNKPFKSTYWIPGHSVESGEPLQEMGFDEFPIMAPRWDVVGDDVYGYSPGMDTLGDIKQLQLMEKRKAEAIDKLVRPPMVADSSLKNQRTTILPGDVTYIDNIGASQHAAFRPAYEINPRLQELAMEIQNVERRISKTFYEDMMLMFAQSDASQVTAREVEERHQEKLLILGPVLERMNSELLDPAIDRTFGIMLRRGLIPQPPVELQNTELRVDYISIMAQAQKMLGVANVQQFFGFVGNLAQMNPSVLDKVDFDHAVDEFANMQGVSPKIINSTDEVGASRQAQAQKKQAAESMQMMAAMAPMANQAAGAAKSLSETGLEGTNALTQIMGVGA